MNQQTAKRAFTVGFILVLGLIFLTGCGGEPTAEPVEPEPEAEATEEAKVYDGSFKFTGAAVVGVEGSNIKIDPSVSEGDDGNTFTDITVKENMTDFAGNVFTPGIYEFQFVEFPEQTGVKPV